MRALLFFVGFCLSSFTLTADHIATTSAVITDTGGGFAEICEGSESITVAWKCGDFSCEATTASINLFNMLGYGPYSLQYCENDCAPNQATPSAIYIQSQEDLLRALKTLSAKANQK